MISQAYDTQPAYSADTQTASLLRVCGIVATRIMWGGLRVWRENKMHIADIELHTLRSIALNLRHYVRGMERNADVAHDV